MPRPAGPRLRPAPAPCAAHGHRAGGARVGGAADLGHDGADQVARGDDLCRRDDQGRLCKRPSVKASRVTDRSPRGRTGEAAGCGVNHDDLVVCGPRRWQGRAGLCRWAEGGRCPRRRQSPPTGSVTGRHVLALPCQRADGGDAVISQPGDGMGRLAIGGLDSATGTARKGWGRAWRNQPPCTPAGPAFPQARPSASGQGISSSPVHPVVGQKLAQHRQRAGGIGGSGKAPSPRYRARS